MRRTPAYRVRCIRQLVDCRRHARLKNERFWRHFQSCRSTTDKRPKVFRHCDLDVDGVRVHEYSSRPTVRRPEVKLPRGVGYAGRADGRRRGQGASVALLAPVRPGGPQSVAIVRLIATPQSEDETAAMSCEHLKDIVRWPCTLRKTWTVAGNQEGKLNFGWGSAKPGQFDCWQLCVQIAFFPGYWLLGCLDEHQTSHCPARKTGCSVCGCTR